MTRRIWIAASVFGFLAMTISPVYAQTPPPPRMVTVSGEAEEEVAPDRAVLSLSLVNRDADLQKAKRGNDALVEKLVAIAHDFDIPKEKIAASGLHLSPEYNYDKGQRRFVGYTVSRSFRLTMDKLSVHERVLSAVVAAGIDQVNHVEFTLADREAKAQAVRARAVENARARALTLAQAAGAKLGKVISIAAAGASLPPPMPYLRTMTAESADASTAPSLPGMIALRESVTASFELE